MTTGVRPDWLYELLPAYHREEDERRGHPLRALVRLVQEQAELLDADVQQLWDNFFVETADRWAVPYIGDLVGNELLHAAEREEDGATAEQLFVDLVGPRLRPSPAVRVRADVAKTIYYRRRKGTLPMLEELARDVTGWAAHAVEFFELLHWTQHLEHLRPHSTDAPALRTPELAGRAHGPFDAYAHTVDMRRIAAHEGWHAIKNVGFFLWRLRSYAVPGVDARPAAAPEPPWAYRASPLGHDAPLFARWRREGDETGLATELHVPGPIRPAAFHDDLRRHAAAAPPPLHSDFYGQPADHADFSLAVTVGAVPVPPERIRCANLEPWVQPAEPDVVAVDVRRGRLALGAGWPAVAAVRVDAHHGFSADLGGGPYDRSRWLVRPELADLVLTVSQDVPTADAATIGGALALWAAAAHPNAIVRILDSRSYAEPLAVDVPAGRWLAIEAANGQRPHLRPTGGAITAGPGHETAELTLSGLLVEGGVEITGELGRLRLLHTTLVPGRALDTDGAPISSDVSVQATDTVLGVVANATLRVELAYSITGPLRLPAHAAGLWLLDSIVDGLALAGGGWGTALCAPGTTDGEGPPAHVERSTILGALYARELPLGSESIFADTLVVTRRQQGCVRFSWLPPDSTTPRQYRCQPQLALDAAASVAEEALVIARLVPGFTALRYGHPAYAQLRLASPVEIRRGAADESEMGAFCHLKQPQRETNLRIRLEEYLPVGLDAGLIYVT